MTTLNVASNFDSSFRGDSSGIVHLWLVSRREEQQVFLREGEDASSSLKVDHCAKMSAHNTDMGSPVTALHFSKEQALLASGQQDGAVHIWDIQVTVAL